MQFLLVRQHSSCKDVFIRPIACWQGNGLTIIRPIICWQDYEKLVQEPLQGNAGILKKGYNELCNLAHLGNFASATDALLMAWRSPPHFFLYSSKMNMSWCQPDFILGCCNFHFFFPEPGNSFRPFFFCQAFRLSFCVYIST